MCSTRMEELSVWAPPEISNASLCVKVNEWMRLNPTKPPYERFIQDYISSQWLGWWHLKIEHKVTINKQERLSIPVTPPHYETGLPEPPPVEDVCPICHNTLGADLYALACGHGYHTMCIHTWLRRANTCPMCRATV
jgi:hypothetical protein